MKICRDKKIYMIDLRINKKKVLHSYVKNIFFRIFVKKYIFIKKNLLFIFKYFKIFNIFT